MMEKKLSIVIGTYNRLEFLRQCLDSLIGKIRVGHEIVVIDAGSTDGTLNYLENAHGIRLVCDGKLVGQAKSLNRVMKTLDSDWVCWLSDDNIAVDGMLDTAVEILERNADIGMVGLKVQDIGADAFPEYLGGIWDSGVLTVNQGMLSTKLFQSLGGFDEEFGDYGIDGDLTTRVLLRGYKVVFTKHIALYHFRHRETTSWIDVEGREERMKYAKKLYARKYADLIKSEYDGKYDKNERFVQFRRVEKRYRTNQKQNLWEKWIGLNLTDWKNLIVARFIQRGDSIRCLHRRYHLVQQMPKRLIIQLKISRKEVA